MGRATIRERQLQLREDAILDAAQQLLVEQGYVDLNMDTLAARAGLAKATLYQHFASKETLLLALVLRMVRASIDYLNAGDGSLPAVERIRRWLRSIVEGRIGLPQGRMETSATVRGSAEYLEERRRLGEALARLVDQAKADGDVTTLIPTPVLSRLLPRCVHDADFTDLVDEGRYDAAEVSEMVVAVIFTGLTPRDHPAGE
jgi:TetR/AcrR family transcriptional regulator, regulator of autoinduction and epiphytic fitness